jgi:hypothetical protein
MTYKFGLQKQKQFGTHSEICKSLRGVGLIVARMFGGTFDPLWHHCYVAVINEESQYLTTKDILQSSKEDADYFRREGKQIIHVCTNCGQVQEDLKK